MPAPSPTRSGWRTCLIHPMASLLSAYGMGLADIRATPDAGGRGGARRREPAGGGGAARRARRRRRRREVEAQGVPAGQIRAAPGAAPEGEGDRHGAADRLRRAGGAAARRSQAAHRARFGFDPGDAALVIEAVEAEAVGGRPTSTEAARAGGRSGRRRRSRRRWSRRSFSAARWVEARFVRREALAARRPAERAGGAGRAAYLDPGRAGLAGADHRARPCGADAGRAAAARGRRSGTRADPVMLEVFNNLYMSIAEQMGAVLENTAASVTIKERLDFSCAVFDAAGDLIANAPHMPVHLGSMGASVKAIIAQNPEMAPGDVFVLNAPYNGGTHLPDITVVRPVWDDGGRRGAVLHRRARAPHRRRRADAGVDAAGQPDDPRRGRLYRQLEAGRRAGGSARRRRARCCSRRSIRCGRRRSTSPTSRRRSRPARRGRRSCAGWSAQFGLEVVRAYMRPRAGQRRGMRAPGDRGAEGRRVRLSDGPGLRRAAARDPGAGSRVDRAARSAVIDFTGTTAELATNYNAPEPVTRAAVLYVFRCLVDDDIPMNEGVMKPLEVILPPGTMLSPALSGGGDRGQRRDQPGGDLGAVPRARGAGGGAVDDEQHHLGRRAAAVLRDGLRRHRAPGVLSDGTRLSGDERACIRT